LDEIRQGILDTFSQPSRARRFAYAYFGDLDLIGHVHGPGSPKWLQSLREVDKFVTDLATDLPRDCRLLLTADHGMVAAETVIDIDATPALLTDVEAVAGEARVRHVYARHGAARDVLHSWRAQLTDLARVISREQALDEQLFGPDRDHA